LFSKIAAPFVWLLSSSTRIVLKILKIDTEPENKVTEDEIKAIIQEGTEGGEIQEVEQDIVERVFHLSDRDVSSIMTHRNDLDWLDIEDDANTVIARVKADMHTVYPVANERIDNIQGVVLLKEMFGSVYSKDFKLSDFIHPAQFVPENMNAYDVLELFKQTRVHYALVSDEFGNLQGMVTMFDMMDAIVGDISETAEDEYKIIRREDGSWIIDGQYSFFDFLAFFNMEDLYQEYDYNTISGLILDIIKKIPQEGDHLEWMGFDFEIVDMDGARIDKVLVSGNNFPDNEGTPV
jgi:putative hemolysin